MSEVTEAGKKPNASLLIRGAIWIAIGALIAAALVCVVWVLIGDQDGIIGRAFLTILLLAGFAGIAILEAGLATRRPDWLALASMITWIVALIAGAIKIWLPAESYEYAGGLGRFFMLVAIVAVLQLALLHVRLFTPAAHRYVTTFTQIIYYATIGVLALLVAMLVIYLTVPDAFEYGDIYWRIVVALAILAAVGTTLVPLLNALFAPKKNAGSYAPQAYGAPLAYGAVAPVAPAQQQWPTYADGFTPLPVMADGSPDWNAYYTGYPTPQQPVLNEAVSPAPSGYAQPAEFVSSPDAPIGHDGLPVPPAGAPAAPDGIAGASAGYGNATYSDLDATHERAPEQPVPGQSFAPPVPPAPEQTVPPVPPVPEQAAAPEQTAAPEQPATPEQPQNHEQPPAPGAFPPPPPAPRQ